MTKYTERLEHVIHPNNTLDWIGSYQSVDKSMTVIGKLQGNSGNFTTFTSEALSLLNKQFVDLASNNNLIVDDVLDQAINYLSEPGSNKIFDTSHLLHVYDAIDNAVENSTLMDDFKNSYEIIFDSIQNVSAGVFDFNGLHYPEYPENYKLVGLNLDDAVSELSDDQAKFLTKAQDVFDNVIVESLDDVRQLEFDEELGLDDLSGLGYAPVPSVI